MPPEDTATTKAKGGRYGERLASGRRPASVEFPEADYEALKRQAAVEERSMAAVVRHAVREYIARETKKRA